MSPAPSASRWWTRWPPRSSSRAGWMRARPRPPRSPGTTRPKTAERAGSAPSAPPLGTGASDERSPAPGSAGRVHAPPDGEGRREASDLAEGHALPAQLALLADDVGAAEEAAPFGGDHGNGRLDLGQAV